MEIKTHYFFTMLGSFSAGSLTSLAIWGKGPIGGDEFGPARFCVVALFLICGHVFYNTVLRKHFVLD